MQKLDHADRIVQKLHCAEIVLCRNWIVQKLGHAEIGLCKNWLVQKLDLAGFDLAEIG